MFLKNRKKFENNFLLLKSSTPFFHNSIFLSHKHSKKAFHFMPFPSAFLPNFFKISFFIVDFLLFVFSFFKNNLTVLCDKNGSLKNDRRKYFILFL